jgi:two-component system CheB/CheR fusion protein
MATASDFHTCAPPEAPGALHVLVVEDNDECAFAMGRLLTRMGHEVSHAADGLSALAAALSRPPDVVLLDIGLPDMDGYEVAARLRAARGRTPPFIIALSGSVCDEGRREAAGIDLYLTKPVEPADLGRVLRQFWRASRGVVEVVGP